jgi:hypothetical protein
MKKLIILLLIITGCTGRHSMERETFSLAGEWKFRIDSLDKGIDQKWFSDEFTETVLLPGSMAENGKGDEVGVNTDWTGDIIDRSYFTGKKYEKYRQAGNIKIPFWLKPVKYYKGAAWYQKTVEIPAEWTGKRVLLSLGRCHWESTVFVNDKSAGSQNSLATPHEFDLTDILKTGKNLISIRIDNRMIIPVGVNSHSVSDHTQSNWNGITGTIKLTEVSNVFIDDIKVFPDIKKHTARIIVNIRNKTGADFKGKLTVMAQSFNSAKVQKLPPKIVTIVTNPGEQQMVIDYKVSRPQLWSEFFPVLYKLSVDLKGRGKIIDHKSTDFGMREFRGNGTRLEINGQPVFLRGTTECCIFPITGYPPSDVPSWEKVLQTCKEYGLNHVRFHSYCPPEAAFIAADKLGIYLHIECSSWANQGTSIGDGRSIDKFIYEESDRILKEYGNHPSFCMLAYGNEPAGDHQKDYLGKLLSYWKSRDNRRVYTSAAGWPVIPENDYNLTPEPRIQQWGQGLKSIINGSPPQTMFDYRDIVSRYKIPIVSHEIGQWCVYPDFKEIDKYKGVMKPTNFEIFKETLEENHMGDQAEKFLMASGRLQVLCYKAEIEAALRTPGFAGFEILQLHDFPGQGTALVGILNPFFESKGYITPMEFRMFCNQTVPLARMEKMVYSAGEKFKADLEISHFGASPLKNATIVSRILNCNSRVLFSDSTIIGEIATGNCQPAGTVLFDLADVEAPEKLTLEVSLKNTPFLNRWDFWVYPDTDVIHQGNVIVTDKLDRKSEETLQNGGSVLLLGHGKVDKTKGAQVAIGFSSIFWNTAWTNYQPPHTLGIVCDHEHPLFREFPTEDHSNWQWWDPVTHSQAMIIDDLPPDLKPLIQPIDTWFENRRLALAFEVRTGGGKLLVCSIDMQNFSGERLSSRQLYISILKYMNSELFDPQIDVDMGAIKELFTGKAM